MCISILSTAHPQYPFIVISNRDEYISRPTARAHWWDPPNQQVLGGRDLQRKEKGTWLGITKQGRIVILTNFREEGDFSVDMTKSRGAMVNSYLTVSPKSTESEEQFVERLMNDVGISDVGGFTMLFGKLRAPRPVVDGQSNGTSSHAPRTPGLATVSNRTKNPESLLRIATTLGETHGISNSHFGDLSWPKVVHGEQFLKQAIEADVLRRKSEPEYNEDSFISRLFDILCVDTLPERKISEDWDAFVRHMRNSIMVPALKGEIVEGNDAGTLRSADANLKLATAVPKLSANAYGTSKQTVILVNQTGKVVFVERTLYDDKGFRLKEEDQDVRFDFSIEGWGVDRSNGHL